MNRVSGVQVDLEDPEACLKLLRTVARSEPLGVRQSKVSKGNISAFKSLFKHPLPVSGQRCQREENLRRIECVTINKQAAGAVSIRDAWVLEEIYIKGSPVDLPDANGFTPLHLAVQLNDYECIMVLLNIGVNINAATLSGFTPLYLSIATRSKQAEQLLLENGARMFVESSWANPGFTILDQSQRRKTKKLPPLGVLQQVDAYLGVPDRQLMY